MAFFFADLSLWVTANGIFTQKPTNFPVREWFATGQLNYNYLKVNCVPATFVGHYEGYPDAEAKAEY